ncbi:DUF1028 domain-containing protein [Mangrovicoccus sp. HB161399]|uniref:DUF1028 domain-containing protein n=1 Tax=Mangrovicoccus sp. HB161399 TaxID=2720392 RepID=UPI00155335FD|nr:DUF1028 domain-containing protein [Mangrovicoccus sp. HB161399]
MTYSIIGLCPDTGMIGGAITTSSPAVGARCLFVEAGYGAALSQYWTDPRLGRDALGLMVGGLAPDAALGELMQRPYAEVRQLAALSPDGRAAHATGTQVAGAVSCATGPGCVAIGNILASEAVADAMVAAFAAAPADGPVPLAGRLLAALRAGDAAGGEVKQVSSAALKIADAQSFPLADLRIDHDADPIVALERLWALYAPDVRAYEKRALAPF